MRDYKDLIVDRLLKHGLTLTLAESVTGGMIAATLISVPGASATIKGGVVAYSPEAKQKYLGVREETMREHGLISRQVAREMAVGAVKSLNTSVGVAVTGIAGPATTENKPVGLYYFCIIVRDRAYDFKGQVSAAEAMQMLKTSLGSAALNCDEADLANHPQLRSCYRRLMTIQIIEQLFMLLANPPKTNFLGDSDPSL